MEQEELIQQFNKDVDQIIEESLKTFKHCGRFVQIVRFTHSGNGYAATKQMLRNATPANVFGPLRQSGQLDLTVESLVVKPQYKELFDSKEKQIAEFRLTTEE